MRWLGVTARSVRSHRAIERVDPSQNSRTKPASARRRTKLTRTQLQSDFGVPKTPLALLDPDEPMRWLDVTARPVRSHRAIVSNETKQYTMTCQLVFVS